PDAGAGHRAAPDGQDHPRRLHGKGEDGGLTRWHDRRRLTETAMRAAGLARANAPDPPRAAGGGTAAGGLRRALENQKTRIRQGAPMNLPRTPMGSASGWRPVDPPRRPVLFVNPRSGGGKAARAGLAERARERGIEAVVLDPGQDLAALARDAAAGGADVLGVAGGDGSLAVVAAV